MIGWSVRRRLLYFAVSLVVVAIGVAGVVLVVKPVPSCFDGRQNQDELAIDCGGSCARVCPFEVEDVRVAWARVLPVEPGRYDVAALVSNPNLHHGVPVLKYSIKILDKDNLLISTRRGSTFVNPGEDVLIFEGKVEVGRRVPARAVFSLDEPPVWQHFTTDVVTPEVGHVAFTNEPTPRLTATLTNPSLTELKNFTVMGLLSDADYNAVAVSSTLVEALAPGASGEVAFTWPRQFASAPLHYDIYPHVAPLP